MLYDLNHVLLDHRGEPIHEDKQPVTLGAALERAAIQGGDPRQDAKAKFEQFKLAQKLAKGGLIELTAEEVARLKELAGTVFTPLAVGAVWTSLENPLTSLVDYPVGGTD